MKVAQVSVDHPLVHEFKQVIERLSAVPKTASTRDKELLLLACFLSHTEFAARTMPVDLLNARAREFEETGWLARCGWAIKRHLEAGMKVPTWTLARLP